MLTAPILIILFLASCTRGGNEASALLNADDLWDQLAAERDKPLSAITGDTPERDLGGPLEDIPKVGASDPFSAKAFDGHRETLRSAQKQYLLISTSLDQFLRELPRTGDSLLPDDRLALWRTAQLYLSRLISLKKNMGLAINALEPINMSEQKGEEDSLLNQSRELRTVIAAHITRAQNRLAEVAP